MPYGEEITIDVGDAVRIHPNYENYKFKKLKYGVTYFVRGMDVYGSCVTWLNTKNGDSIVLNMDKRYFEHAGKEEAVKTTFERNYELFIGDVVLVTTGGYGLVDEDECKYVEVVGKGSYFGDPGVEVKPYQCVLETAKGCGSIGDQGVVGYESFGNNPMVLLNTLEESELPEEEVPDWDDDISTNSKDTYTADHYDLYYTLTENDIEAGKIKVDAYWVAKQWKTGSRDDSGALWHSLKTIARFGEKNDKAREIKALYNQALALARIYDVEL